MKSSKTNPCIRHQLIRNAPRPSSKLVCPPALQLRGSSDLWAAGADHVAGTSFVPEANALPIAPQSPAFETPPGSAVGNGHAPDAGIASLEYCKELKLLVAVLSDGRVVLCSAGGRGLRPVNEITPER